MGTHKLAMDQHRVVDVGGRFLLSVFRDKKLVATATTGFRPRSLVASDPPDRSLAPVVSPAGAACLNLLRLMDPKDLGYLVVLSGSMMDPYSNHVVSAFTRQPRLSFLDVPRELRRDGPLIRQLWEAYQASVNEDTSTTSTTTSSGIVGTQEGVMYM